MPPRLGLGHIWFLGLVVACGCSRSQLTADPGEPPPHGGKLIFIPDGTALIEVVKKQGAAPITAEVSFYFYKEGGYEPYEPAPQSGVLVIDEKHKVPLQTDGNALVTPTGPVLFEGNDVDGVLSVELNGELRQIPLGLR
jgi:hypothetical protein